MRANEFIKKLLNDRQFGIDTLIEAVGGQETDWLEFKDSLEPRDGQYKNGENKADYQWNLAKAVIAMANTRGGAVLVGVQEDPKTGKPVPAGLFAAQEKHKKNWDEYYRNIIEPALNPKNGWKTGRGEHWSCDFSRINSRVEPIRAEWHGTIIGVLVVKPVGEDENPILAKDSTRQRSVLFRRKKGTVGKCEPVFDFDEINRYWSKRKLDFDPPPIFDPKKPLSADRPPDRMKRLLGCFSKKIEDPTQPVRRIAVFGPEKSGETTFWASLCESVHATFALDEDTRATLEAHWKKIESGEDCSPAGSDRFISLRFRMHRSGRTWIVETRDYPGDPAQPGTKRNPEKRRARKMLDAWTADCDALLLLLPVELLSGSKDEQRKFKNEVERTTKAFHDAPSTKHLPVCLAITKADRYPETPCSPSKKLDRQEVEDMPQMVGEVVNLVEQQTGQQNTAVFCVSAFGGHSPDNPDKPPASGPEPVGLDDAVLWMLEKSDAALGIGAEELCRNAREKAKKLRYNTVRALRPAILRAKKVLSRGVPEDMRDRLAELHDELVETLRRRVAVRTVGFLLVVAMLVCLLFCVGSCQLRNKAMHYVATNEARDEAIQAMVAYLDNHDCPFFGGDKPIVAERLLEIYGRQFSKFKHKLSQYEEQAETVNLCDKVIQSLRNNPDTNWQHIEFARKSIERKLNNLLSQKTKPDIPAILIHAFDGEDQFSRALTTVRYYISHMPPVPGKLSKIRPWLDQWLDWADSLNQEQHLAIRIHSIDVHGSNFHENEGCELHVDLLVKPDKDAKFAPIIADVYKEFEGKIEFEPDASDVAGKIQANPVFAEIEIKLREDDKDKGNPDDVGSAKFSVLGLIGKFQKPGEDFLVATLDVPGGDENDPKDAPPAKIKVKISGLPKRAEIPKNN